MKKYWRIVREGTWKSDRVDMRIKGESKQTVYEVTINDDGVSAMVVITHHFGFETTSKEVRFKLGQSNGQNPFEAVNPLILIDLATKD